MSLIYNDYQKIRQDNADAIAKISAKNTGAVMKMFRYISAFDVSLFELEVIKKDIIGIVLEADAEEMKIEEKLGVSEKEFCDSLLQNGMNHNLWEKWILRLKNFFLVLFAFYSLDFLAMALTNEWGIPVIDMVYAFVCTILNEIIEQYAIRKCGYREKKVERRIRVVVSLVIIFTFLTMIPQQISLRLFEGHARLAWLGLLVITVSVYLLNSAYWNRCSKQYDWK